MVVFWVVTFRAFKKNGEGGGGVLEFEDVFFSPPPPPKKMEIVDLFFWEEGAGFFGEGAEKG